MSNVGIIGGADGPTAIFVTSALPRMLNPWGMAIILLMMIPNVIFALRHRNMENRCKSRFINILEQIGRYGCLILMIICIGLDKFGFGSVEDFLIYLFQTTLNRDRFLQLQDEKYSWLKFERRHRHRRFL